MARLCSSEIKTLPYTDTCSSPDSAGQDLVCACLKGPAQPGYNPPPTLAHPLPRGRGQSPRPRAGGCWQGPPIPNTPLLSVEGSLLPVPPTWDERCSVGCPDVLAGLQHCAAQLSHALQPQEGADWQPKGPQRACFVPARCSVRFSANGPIITCCLRGHVRCLIEARRETEEGEDEEVPHHPQKTHCIFLQRVCPRSCLC